MKKLNSPKLIEYYYNKYNLGKIFTNEIKSSMKLFSYDRHEHIFTDRYNIDYIFLFVKGKAKVYNTLSNGKSLLLCFYNPLMILGDLELVTHSAIPTNVQALNTCHCIGIPINYAKEILINDMKFIKFITESLAHKLDRCSINSSINLLYKLENRLASYILSTSINISSNNSNSFIFDENLVNVADLLGTSYRHLLRTLAMFCNKNILKKGESFYEIVNIETIKDLASDLYK